MIKIKGWLFFDEDNKNVYLRLTVTNWFTEVDYAKIDWDLVALGNSPQRNNSLSPKTREAISTHAFLPEQNLVI